jgi:hypothetical protein
MPVYTWLFTFEVGQSEIGSSIPAGIRADQGKQGGVLHDGEQLSFAKHPALRGKRVRQK